MLNVYNVTNTGDSLVTVVKHDQVVDEKINKLQMTIINLSKCAAAVLVWRHAFFKRHIS